MQRVAIIGAGGQLGRSMSAAFDTAGWTSLAADRSVVDITNPASFRRLIEWRPDVVVNCAAWTDVDGCARDPDRANLINGLAPGEVARACRPALFVQISTNEVFAGDRGSPYDEADLPRPVNPYGVSKLMGEQQVQESGTPFVIVRTAWLFGPGGVNFVTKILGAARSAADRGDALRVVADEWGNPTWTPMLAALVVDLLGRTEAPPNVLHVAGEPPTTRFSWAESVVADLEPQVELRSIRAAEFSRASTAPPRAILSTQLVRSLADVDLGWERPLANYVRNL